MSSGVEIADDCVTTYQQLKLGKPEQLKYILFGLSKDLSKIVVDETSNAPAYETFVAALPKRECRWAVYDFEYEKDGNGKRKKLCFVSWSPDDAKVKDKMLFASSRETLRKRLDGIAFEVQGTDPSEISYETVLAKALTSTH